MIRIELTVEVARPPEDVFELLSDIERLSEWQASAVEAHTDGPLAEGSRVREKRRLLGREVDTELEVVAYEPPRRLTLRSLGGPVKFTVDHELVAQAAAARSSGSSPRPSLAGSSGSPSQCWRARPSRSSAGTSTG